MLVIDLMTVFNEHYFIELFLSVVYWLRNLVDLHLTLDILIDSMFRLNQIMIAFSKYVFLIFDFFYVKIQTTAQSGKAMREMADLDPHFSSKPIKMILLNLIRK